MTNTDVEMEVSHEEERPKSALLVSTEHFDISLLKGQCHQFLCHFEWLKTRN